MAIDEGYKCEFVDSVPEDFYCKRCTLVARRLALTSCCGESFCQTCIADTQEQGQPCPVCEAKQFNTFEQVKNQKKINSLQVYCSTKERGCVWSGTLDQLDTHLDPHLDNCQYVDTKCPINCLQTIPKNKVDHHVAQECTKRPHVCQHCGFEATYEEVVDTHWPECKYVPLQCPNMCGVGCEREIMEDHMKICRLEEVKCEFSSVGCDGQFIREDQDEHARQNSQKHITLTASLAIETKEQLQQKLLEQEDENEKLRNIIESQEKMLLEQHKKLQEHEKKMEEQTETQRVTIANLKEIQIKMAECHDSIFKHMDKSLKEAAVMSEKRLADLGLTLHLNRNFVMENVSKQKGIGYRRSPAMYTHMHGYRFCIEVDPFVRILNFVKARICSMPGEFDDQLKWPVTAQFTIELINQQGGKNCKRTTKKIEWNKPPTTNEELISGSDSYIVKHAILNQFLINDALHFFISKLEVIF